MRVADVKMTKLEHRVAEVKDERRVTGVKMTKPGRRVAEVNLTWNSRSLSTYIVYIDYSSYSYYIYK